MLETTKITFARPRPARLNAAVRELLARLSQGAPRPVPVGQDADPRFPRLLRDNAHAAFLSVQGPQAAALDAALAVVEGEMARLRAAVLTYGEALKAIQTYGADAAARTTAAAALRQAPVPLGAPPLVPHLTGEPGGGRHD